MASYMAKPSVSIPTYIWSDLKSSIRIKEFIIVLHFSEHKLRICLFDYTVSTNESSIWFSFSVHHTILQHLPLLTKCPFHCLLTYFLDSVQLSSKWYTYFSTEYKQAVEVLYKENRQWKKWLKQHVNTHSFTIITSCSRRVNINIYRLFRIHPLQVH